MGCARRPTAHTGLVVAAAILLLLPGTQPSPEPAHALVGVALALGALLMVRVRPREPGTTLLLIPALVAESRFGAAALPAVGFASLLGAVLHRVRGAHLATAPAQTMLAYAGAELATWPRTWSLSPIRSSRCCWSS